jgi:transposase-like protein
MDAAAIMETTIADSMTGLSSRQRNGVIVKAVKALRQQTGQELKKKLGRPSRYTPKLGDQICQHIIEGKTLREVCREMDIAFYAVMDWLDKHQDFKEHYTRARKAQSVNLVDALMEETQDLGNDRALGVRVRADVVKWFASRMNPEMFADTKRIELSGEVHHKHSHELAHEQKQRIAEAWLLSQSDKADTPGITASTTGPAKEPALIEVDALDNAGVREICNDEQRVIPKRKRTASPDKPAIKGKPGRKRKPIVDQLAD